MVYFAHDLGRALLVEEGLELLAADGRTEDDDTAVEDARLISASRHLNGDVERLLRRDAVRALGEVVALGVHVHALNRAPRVGQEVLGKAHCGLEHRLRVAESRPIIGEEAREAVGVGRLHVVVEVPDLVVHADAEVGHGCGQSLSDALISVSQAIRCALLKEPPPARSMKRRRPAWLRATKSRG